VHSERSGRTTVSPKSPRPSPDENRSAEPMRGLSFEVFLRRLFPDLSPFSFLIAVRRFFSCRFRFSCRSPSLGGPKFYSCKSTGTFPLPTSSCQFTPLPGLSKSHGSHRAPSPQYCPCCLPLSRASPVILVLHLYECAERVFPPMSPPS